MSKAWPLAPVGKILSPVSRPENVDSQETYCLLGARSYAGGLYTKDVKLGSQIQAAKLYRVEEEDFIYNRLFAWKGSFAIATKENHDCYVSNEFPCFHINRELADGRYLWKYFSRSSVWEEAVGLSTGGTPISRNRLKEEKLLAMKIPLPPLIEQRRIVARIDELAAKIEEARGLRRQAVEAAAALAQAVMRQLFHADEASPRVTLESVCAEIVDNLHSNPVYADNGIPCVRSPDVGRGKLYLDTALKTSEEEYIQRTVRGEPKEDDIVLVREGGERARRQWLKKGNASVSASVL